MIGKCTVIPVHFLLKNEIDPARFFLCYFDNWVVKYSAFQKHFA